MIKVLLASAVLGLSPLVAFADHGDSDRRERFSFGLTVELGHRDHSSHGHHRGHRTHVEGWKRRHDDFHGSHHGSHWGHGHYYREEHHRHHRSHDRGHHR
jgi:hypothetical protein